MTDLAVDLLAHAAELVITTQFGSASMLKRKMRVGDGEVEKTLIRLHELGIVGRPEEGRARDVLVSAEACESAVACVRAGVRYTRAPVPATGVPTESFRLACNLTYSAMPDDMADFPARHLALRIVGLLMDAGWRPTR